MSTTMQVCGTWLPNSGLAGCVKDLGTAPATAGIKKLKFGRLTAAARSGFVIGAFMAAALGLSLLFGGSTLEDAHITFRYARNFGEGAGFGVWNIGEPPVEGATSFLWMLLLGFGEKVGISPFVLSKAVGIASLLGIILLFGHLSHSAAQRGEERTARTALAAAALAAVYVPLAWYAVSGMETTFFSLLVAFTVVSIVSAQPGMKWVIADCLVIVLLVLLRPEGMLIGLMLAGAKIFMAGGHRIARFAQLGTLALAIAGIESYRLLHFGDPLPNTYYAKASGELGYFLRFGNTYLRQFLKNTWPIWLTILAGGFIAWKRRDSIRAEPLFAIVVALYFAYVLRAGGDPVSAFPLWRHFVHIAPLWLFLAGAAITRLGQNRAQVITLSMIVGLLTAVTMYVKTIAPLKLEITPGFAVRQADNPYFDFVNRITDSEQLAAVSLAGQWGWYLPIKTIDMLGLNNRHIAHFGKFQLGGFLDSKTDMGYVMAQRPTIIDGYMSGILLREGKCPNVLHGGRSDLLLGMLRYPGTLDNYFFVSNAPYEVVDRAIFVSASLAGSARSAGAELVPLRQTVLGDADCIQ
jgi:arabinofuranosyltransferase